MKQKNRVANQVEVRAKKMTPGRTKKSSEEQEKFCCGLWLKKSWPVQHLDHTLLKIQPPRGSTLWHNPLHKKVKRRRSPEVLFQLPDHALK